MTAFNTATPQAEAPEAPEAQTKDSTIPSVESSNGLLITCRYMLSPHYDPASNLCQTLDFIFQYYIPERIHSNGYLLRSAIEHLLDYVKWHNDKNPEPLHVKKYADINSEIFFGFINYARDKNIPLPVVERFKSAGAFVAKETGKIPLLNLPVVPVEKSKGSPPLSLDGFDTFQKAFHEHLPILWEKLNFRDVVEKAEPYTATEVMEAVQPTPTKERLLQWQAYVKANRTKPKRLTYATRFSQCDDEEIRALHQDEDCVSKFNQIYARDIGNYSFDGSVDPFKTGGWTNWDMDYARAVKTFITHGFPFKYKMDDLYQNYRQPQVTVIPDDCDDVIKMILHRVTTANRSRTTEKLLHLDELFSLYYPDILDMTAILLFMMFQSGWNKETALALDQDNFEHVLTGTVEAAIKVVWAEKNKSQGAGKPFDTPKRINIPTRDDDPRSFYNLIQLARKLSKPLAFYDFDYIPALSSEDRMNPLFLCIRPWAEWKKGGRHTSIAHPKTFRLGVQYFLDQYEVVDDGERLSMAKELTRRLRPTWLLYKKKNNPIALLSMAMGHADRDTTDIFYDNSSAAQQERLKRLRSALDDVINLLRTRQFKGLLGKKAQADASANLKVFHIPGKEKALWGCADQTKPDWAGSEIIASTGRKCHSIRECIFCSQIRIYDDSLPYLMERESHLDELLDDASESGFRSRVAKEREVLRFILDEWGDEEVIEEASRYRRYQSPLLPRDLDILEIIFESEDYNV